MYDVEEVIVIERWVAWFREIGIFLNIKPVQLWVEQWLLESAVTSCLEESGDEVCHALTKYMMQPQPPLLNSSVQENFTWFLVQILVAISFHFASDGSNITDTQINTAVSEPYFAETVSLDAERSAD